MQIIIIIIIIIITTTITTTTHETYFTGEIILHVAQTVNTEQLQHYIS
jgi:hypothetical protein